MNNFPKLKVNLNNPELDIEIDIRKEGTIIFDNRLKRPSGLPIGTSSKDLTKNGTIKLSQKFALYKTSILPYEDSCSVFIPSKPATKSNTNYIKSIEDSLQHLSKLEKDALDEVKKYKIEDSKVSKIDHFES